MADRLTLFTAKSIAKWLGDNVSGIDAAYVTTPDFDYDKKPHPTNRSLVIDRPLPFITVETTTEFRGPFSVSANILYEVELVYNIGVYAESYSDCLNYTGDMLQSLSSAEHPVSSKVGVPLYDFDAVSGTFYDLVGAVQVMDLGVTAHFGPGTTDEQENRKHRSISPVTFTAFKDKSAKLLENLGNININD